MAALGLFALCAFSDHGLSGLFCPGRAFAVQRTLEVKRVTYEKSENASTPSGSDTTNAARTPRPFRKRFWVRAILYVIGIYILWCTMLYFYQDRMLFPRDMAASPRSKAPDDAIVTRLDIGDGEFVESWFFPAPAGDATRPAPAIMYFHGNAEIIDFQDPIVMLYREAGCSVLLVEFRGYGRSGGRPSQRAVTADSVRFYDELIKREDVDKSRIVFHGRSLGGAIAADLTLRRPPAALILESTFSSVAAMAYKYGAPTFLVKNPFRTDHVVQALDIPILIMHGGRDRIIPVSHGRKLRDLAHSGTYVAFDCGHNDFPGAGNEAAYRTAVRDFLSKANVTR